MFHCKSLTVLIIHKLSWTKIANITVDYDYLVAVEILFHTLLIIDNTFPAGRFRTELFLKQSYHTKNPSKGKSDTSTLTSTFKSSDIV